MSITMLTTNTSNDAQQAYADQSDDHGMTLFDRDDLRQFAADDAEAGRRIGKILSALFIYTLIAMGIAIWWTFRTVGQ